VKRSLVACSLLFVAGCTPGSFATSGSGGAAGIAHVVTIDADLSKNGGGPTPAGFAAGTYLYGCFYHYGSPMRAEIIVL